MSPRHFLSLVATLIAIALGYGVEPAATPFDIRHDATELLNDLQINRGEPRALLERVQNLSAAHGDSMIANGDLCAPLSELFAIRLAELGLAESFSQTFSGIAERRFREMVTAHGSESELRILALSYPGTKAATDAWRRLADLAWDSGRLGLFLDYANRANEAVDKQLSPRMAAAKALLAPEQSLALPDSLNGLEEMWRIDIPKPIATAAQPDNESFSAQIRRLQQEQQAGVPRYALTTSSGGLTAASDGRKMFIFDHVIGRVVGDVHPLGNEPLDAAAARPVATRNGFIGIGWANGKAALTCLDNLGRVKWRWNSPSVEYGQAISAPVVLDNLIVFTTFVVNSQKGAEFRALAFHTDTGRPAWNTLIMPRPMPQGKIYINGDFGMNAPALTVQGGSLMALSNNGLIARMGIDGNVNRLWAYPSTTEEVDNESNNEAAPARRGTIISDGTYVVACPSDSPGVLLYWGPHDHAPRNFQGDGANGEVLDLVGGQALLGGAKILSLFDTSSGKTLWAVPFPRQVNAQGHIGAGRALISTNEQLSLIDSKNGRVIESRSLNVGRSSAVTADLLIEASHQQIIGWGRGASILEEREK